MLSLLSNNLLSIVVTIHVEIKPRLEPTPEEEGACDTRTDTHTHTYPFRSSKMSGSMKLRRDQSSDRLFCSGVPVSSRRLAASYDFRALQTHTHNVHIHVHVYTCIYTHTQTDRHTHAHKIKNNTQTIEANGEASDLMSLQLRFLMRCPSSTTRNFQLRLMRCRWSRIHIS